MHELALTGTQHTLWLTGVIVGFVVVVAVAVLLSLLIYLIKVIDHRVVEIRETLKAASANTDDTALLSTVGGGLDAVLAEGLQHHLFLGRVLGKVKT
jgi:hypothetical protein